VDAAIGDGMELAPGIVTRQLAPFHIIAVASPSYLQGRKTPEHPDDLRPLDGIAMRSAHSGRVRMWFTNQKLLPAKTPAFVDHVTEAFLEQNLAQRFSATG
jgi:DNA-binding transcriptional LysR family regulator